MTSGLRAAVSVSGILMSLSRPRAWISTSVFLSLSLKHISASSSSSSSTFLCCLRPQLSLGILHPRKHRLSGCHLSTPPPHPPASPLHIRYIPAPAPQTHNDPPPPHSAFNTAESRVMSSFRCTCIKAQREIKPREIKSQINPMDRDRSGEKQAYIQRIPKISPLCPGHQD